MKLLTLALPVYNGENCISSTIKSIVAAISLLDDKQKNMFEILISDNKSIDKTLYMIKQFRDAIDIVYYCNESNIGYDGNIDMIIRRAKSRYVWFLGCGEKLKNDSLIRLLEKIDNSIEYTNIVLDFDIYDEVKNKITDKRIFNFNNDILINEKNDFTYNKYSAAVSSNIVNKEKWLKIIDNKFVVDGWCHVERILDMIALNENPNTLLLAYPYFTLYREENGWWTKPNSYLLLLLHIKVIRSMSKKGYSQEVVKTLENKQSKVALLQAIVQSKEYGMNLNRVVILDMIELFKADYFFWFFAFPLLLLPKSLMFIPRSMFKILMKLKNTLN